jgi:peroxiredoxin
MPGSAALPQGTKAPQVATQIALAGKAQNFNLKQALRKGPVVLYFFPKAFTPGCSAEAAAFAQQIGEFKKAGAQVIGLSGDNINDLKQFSLKECAGKFPVGVASPGTIRAYDVALKREGKETGLSDRTSYVIAKDGTIKMVHSELNWAEHVNKTLAAVKALKS